MKRLFFLVLLLIPAIATAADVPWLAEVTTPPASFPTDFAGHMEPLLEHNGQPVRHLEDWKQRRAGLLEQWNQLLGPMPAAPRATYEVVATETLEGFLRQKIRYENEPGQMIEAWLLLPAGPRASRSRAGLVALHQTTGDTIDQIAGVTDSGPQAIGPVLAKRGFVVLCPRCFLWEKAPTLIAAVEQFQARHPGALGMKKMLWDASRAVDILQTVEAVDPARLGAIGHSLGSKETLYLAAFDERIKAAVASEGGLTLKSTNWVSPWYLGPVVREPDFARNHHELLALIAPRAMLILGGESGPGAADGERSWPLIKAAQAIYPLYGQPVRLGLLNHRQGHSIPASAMNRSIEWLETALQ